MAPRRKQRPTPAPGREVKMRLPEDIAERIEAKAKAEGRPMNRIIINELAMIPHLEQIRDLATLVEDMKDNLARYGARITMADLSDELLKAIDAALDAEGSMQEAALDRVRALRGSMRRRKTE
jgi:predicted DNA binding CopG/RHH family protein